MPPDWDDLPLGDLVEPAWYLARYPDVAAVNLDPVAHFKDHGPSDWRDPNRFFDCRWYAAQYPEVAASGLHPIVHYLRSGAASLLNPHPNFDAGWYVRQHPDAAPNPLLYHLRLGLARGFPTEKPFSISDLLPSDAAPPSPRAGVFVDVVVPVFTDVEQAKRCLAPILAGRSFPLARVIVIDHAGSDRRLSSWLDALAADGEIHLIRESQKPSFAACARRGIDAAETHDIVLLRADTQTSAESLRRLAGCAWSGAQVATVSALSDGVAEYGMSTFGRPTSEVEAICQSVNAGRSVQIPSASGGCLYIRRDALIAAGGLIDGAHPAADFCRRATEAGWQHRLACDAFAGCGTGRAQTTGDFSGFIPETKDRLAPVRPIRFASPSPPGCFGDRACR